MSMFAEMTTLYGELRAAILARHFALGRYYRANYFSSENLLGAYIDPNRTTRRFGCHSLWDRPNDSAGQPIYADAGALFGATCEVQELERWRILRHERENPLMMTGMRMINLAVEHKLGYSESTKVFLKLLQAVGTLYKFEGDFAGYIIRHDAATSDHWQVETDAQGNEIPLVCCNFLINPYFTKTNPEKPYSYCVDLENPTYKRAKADNNTYVWKKLLRRWEPSADEYTALITGYSIVFQLLKDDTSNEADAIRKLVRDQVTIIGTYLSKMSYLLVRPCGGFAARGASGFLVALEYAYGRVFKRITDNSFPSEVSFQEGLKRAGPNVWGCLHGVFNAPALTAAVPGAAAIRDRMAAVVKAAPAMVRSALESILEKLSDVPLGGGGSPGAIMALITLLDAIEKMLQKRECFDVWDPSQQGEFVLAMLLKELNPKERFEFYMRVPPLNGNWGDVFKIFLGLTALDDSDDTVKREYLGWYDTYVARIARDREEGKPFVRDGKTQPFTERSMQEWPFSWMATAVAILLRGREPKPDEEKKFARQLPAMFRQLDQDGKRDLTLDNGGYGIGKCGSQEEKDLKLVWELQDKAAHTINWIGGYEVCLALAWLHADRRGLRDRRAARGSAVSGLVRVLTAWRDTLLSVFSVFGGPRLPDEFPPAPDLSAVKWPEAAVPKAVLTDAMRTERGKVILPVAALRRGGITDATHDVDLFGDSNPPDKPGDVDIDKPPEPISRSETISFSLRAPAVWGGEAFGNFQAEIAFPDISQDERAVSTNDYGCRVSAEKEVHGVTADVVGDKLVVKVRLRSWREWWPTYNLQDGSGSLIPPAHDAVYTAEYTVVWIRQRLNC